MSMSEVEAPPLPSTPATPEPAAPAQEESIAAHEQSLKDGLPGPDDDEGPLDDVVDEDSPKFRGSRAKSKRAAHRINELTREKHELRQRVEALEKAQRPTPQPQAPRFSLPSVPTSEFAKPEPQLHDFAEAEDPYGEWMLAKADWRAEKRETERMRSHQTEHVQRVTQEQQQQVARTFDSHNYRLQQTIAAKPELVQAFARVAPQTQDPRLALLNHSLAFDSHGVDMAVYVATHPATFDELVLMTFERPVTQQTVETTQRWLRQRMSADSTGTVAPSSVLPNAPRPPIPVRTGATRISDGPPDETSSIAEHAKHFGPKRR